jgi:hypothetical protein
MKVRYRKGIANHPDPEYCGGDREVVFATPAWPTLILPFGPPDCQFPAFSVRLLWVLGLECSLGSPEGRNQA